MSSHGSHNAPEEVAMSLLRNNGKERNGGEKANGSTDDYSPTDADLLENEVILNTNVTKAPDGGWGWIVVLGAFFCQFIVDGIMFSFDIMRSSFAKEFPDAKPYEIQIMGSLIPGLYLTLAPFANALLNLYGPRPLVIVGSILGTIGLLISGFIENFYGLMFCYGVVGGVAFCLIYSPSVLAVGFYFDKRRATATGIAVCGSCVGTFALSKMMFALDDFYGSWRAVLIICAGVTLNCCVFGCLFRPLPDLVIEQLVITEEEECLEEGKDKADGGVFNSQTILNRVLEEKRRQRSISKGSLENCYITRDNRIVKLESGSQLSLHKTGKQPTLVAKRGRGRDTPDAGGVAAAATGNFSMDVPYVRVARAVSQPRVHSYLHVSRPNSLHQSALSMRSNNVAVQQVPLGSGIMYRRDAYYTGNVQNTPEYREAQAIAAAMRTEDADSIYARSMTYIPPDTADADDSYFDEAEEGDGTVCCGLIKTKAIIDVFKQFDVTLLKSPTFLILGLAAFLGMLGFFTPFFFSSSYGQEKGLTPNQGLWVINCIAIANGVGRVLCGVMSDFPWADSLVITNYAMIISGALNIALPFLSEIEGMPIDILFYIYGILFGLFIAPYVSLRSIIVVDLLGVDKLSAAYGFILLFMGFAAFSGSPILMGIQGVTSFKWVFIISGGVLALSGIICLPIKTFAKWEKQNEEKNKRKNFVQPDEVTPANTPAEGI